MHTHTDRQTDRQTEREKMETCIRFESTEIEKKENEIDK